MIEIGNWHGETHFHIPGPDGPVEVTVLEGDLEYKRRKRLEARTLKLFAFETIEQWPGVVIIAAQTAEEASEYALGRVRSERAIYNSLNNRRLQRWPAEYRTLAQHDQILKESKEADEAFRVACKDIPWAWRPEDEFEPERARELEPGAGEPRMVLMLPGGSE